MSPADGGWYLYEYKQMIKFEYFKDIIWTFIGFILYIVVGALTIHFHTTEVYIETLLSPQL